MDKQSKEVLESLIDRYGLGAVIGALSDVCGDKAQHVNDNWQDTELTQVWDSMGIRLGVLAVRTAQEFEGRV